MPRAELIAPGHPTGINLGDSSRQMDSVRKLSAFQSHTLSFMYVEHVSFLLFLFFFPIRRPKTHLFPPVTDANNTQGLRVASGPGWRATLRTSLGGKRQSGWLVHRLEGGQAFRHRHGRWGCGCWYVCLPGCVWVAPSVLGYQHVVACEILLLY